MQRTIYVIRHAQNAGNRLTRAEYGADGPPLIEIGIEEAKRLKSKLNSYSVDVSREVAAVSELLRAKQTALYAGFASLITNSLLNEVNTGLDPAVLQEMLARNELPKAAAISAKLLLANPPTQRVWVTHGLVIAGLADALGMHDEKLFIPPMGSVTEIQLPTP